MKIPLRRTCLEASRLLTARLDRELGLADRVALRLHLMACTACPGFDQQVKLMDQAMSRWRAQVEGD
jgi:hypothetical protein